MSRTLYLFLFTILAVSLEPCTIFKYTLGGRTLIGNNEDWVEAKSKVWFLSSEPEKLARAYFGFENGWAQGGINEKGLFFDGIMGELKNWKPNSEMLDYPGNLCEKILEEASNVDEAIGYFEAYNFPSLTTGIYFLTDASGKTAIVKFEDGKVKIEISEAKYLALGYNQQKAEEILGKLESVDIKNIEMVLEKCRRKDKYSTQYGNIYDPLNLIVYVYQSKSSTEPIIFDLREEWKKEDHFYELRSYDSAKTLHLSRDHKTKKAIKLNIGVLEKFCGEYNSDSGPIVLSLVDKKLIISTKLIFDGAVNFELVPVANNKFVVRDIMAEAEIERDFDEKVDRLILKFNNKEFQGVKKFG